MSAPTDIPNHSVTKEQVARNTQHVLEPRYRHWKDVKTCTKPFAIVDPKVRAETKRIWSVQYGMGFFSFPFSLTCLLTCRTLKIISVWYVYNNDMSDLFYVHLYLQWRSSLAGSLQFFLRSFLHCNWPWGSTVQWTWRYGPQPCRKEELLRTSMGFNLDSLFLKCPSTLTDEANSHGFK